MPVTTSSWSYEPNTQPDGRRWVHEIHNTPEGEKRFIYLAAVGADPETIMAGRVPSLNEGLKGNEAGSNMGQDSAPSLVEMTGAQFAAAFRACYLASDKAETCRLSWWILRRIAAGDFTDTQVRNAFGLTAPQWTTLKTNKLTPQSNAWAAVLAATGE